MNYLYPLTVQEKPAGQRTPDGYEGENPLCHHRGSREQASSHKVRLTIETPCFVLIINSSDNERDQIRFGSNIAARNNNMLGRQQNDRSHERHVLIVKKPCE